MKQFPSSSPGHTLARERKGALWIALACCIPSLLTLVTLTLHFYVQDKARVQQDQLLTARALAQTVDRELNTVLLVAQSLAQSPHLASGDLAAFDGQARLFLREEFPGFNFVLLDKDSVQLVNTIRPFGTTVADPGSRERNKQVSETGKAVVSDVFMGGLLKRPLMAVTVPVFLDGSVAYTLSVGLLPEQLGQILLTPRLPADRIVAILDSKGVIAARTHEREKYVGQKAAPALLERLKQSGDGVVEAITRDGIPVFAMFSRSLVTGWTVVIGVPRESAWAELLHSLRWIALGLIGLIIATFFVAFYMARRAQASATT